MKEIKRKFVSTATLLLALSKISIRYRFRQQKTGLAELLVDENLHRIKNFLFSCIKFSKLIEMKYYLQNLNKGNKR